MTLSLDKVAYLTNRTVAPTNEPVSLQAAKRACNIDKDETYFDDWFGNPVVANASDNDVGAIRAARELVEAHTNVCLMPQTNTLLLADWPGESEIDLRFHPVYSVAITYVDENGTTQTYGASNYSLKSTRHRSLVVLTDTSDSWPTVSTTTEYPITFTLSCGYANPATYTTAAAQRALVPHAAKMAILMLLAHWFRNREAVTVGTITKEIELSYRSLIEQVRPARYP